MFLQIGSQNPEAIPSQMTHIKEGSALCTSGVPHDLESQLVFL